MGTLHVFFTEKVISESFLCLLELLLSEYVKLDKMRYTYMLESQVKVLEMQKKKKKKGDSQTL